jgi:transposase-like protein
MQDLTELRARGVRNIPICCVDGLHGFPEAIEAIFPKTTLQTCIEHLIRASLRYVPRRDYDPVVKDLRVIYTAIDADRALHALDAFEAKSGQKFPPVVWAWRDAWEHVIPFLAFLPKIRRVTYTTNAIEAGRGPVPWHLINGATAGRRVFTPVRRLVCHHAPGSGVGAGERATTNC